MAKTWIIKPEGTKKISITLPDDVEWNPQAEISPETLLRALAAYVEAKSGGRWGNCSCNWQLG